MPLCVPPCARTICNSNPNPPMQLQVLAVPAVASLAMFGIFAAINSTPLTTATILASVSYLNVMRTSVGKEMSRATGENVLESKAEEDINSNLSPNRRERS